MRQIPGALLALMVVAGCTSGPVETGRVVTDDPMVTAERVAAELTRLGFRRISWGDAAIGAQASRVEPSWATCGPILIGDGDDRHRMVSAGQERGSVRIVLVPTQNGTSVSVSADFAADYRNPFTGTGRERACRSNGVLERMLLDAAAG